MFFVGKTVCYNLLTSYFHCKRGCSTWKVSEKDIIAHRNTLEEVGKAFGIKELNDWYQVSVTQVQNQIRFLKEYSGNLYTALKNLYPQHDWDPSRFCDIPPGFWADITTRKIALEKVGTRLGVNTLDDWYKVDPKTVRIKLSFIAQYYRGSLFGTLKKLFPQHDWEPLKFSQVPRGYWDDLNTQRHALERIGTRFGVKELDDWYSVDPKALRSELSFITHYYKSCLYTALKKLYPQHDWNPLKFSKVPRGYWNDANTQRDALEYIGRQFGVKELDDWYSVNKSAVTSQLSFITHNYQGSLHNALQKLYPEHDWNPLRFSKVPQGFWQNPNTIKHYRLLFKRWQKQHNIQRLKDWYELPPKKVKVFQRVAYGIFGSVTHMLREWFPHSNWIDQLQGSSPELVLQMMLRLVEDDVRVHHRIGKHSVDVYIPEFKLAIEYQGIQHYQQHWRGDFIRQQQRDEDKSEYLLQLDTPILLIPVNCQWNRTWSQLRSTIKGHFFLLIVSDSSTEHLLHHKINYT